MSLVINNIKICVDEDVSSAYKKALKEIRLKKEQVENMYVVKCSVDARKREDIKLVYSIGVDTNLEEELYTEKLKNPNVRLKAKANAQVVFGGEKLEYPPVVVGFGPAGMFAALLLAQNGYRPIVIERGSKVEERVQAVTEFWKNAKFSTKTNVQFGEGGAGTFSDGKLTTRINDEKCSYIIDELIRMGAPEDIAQKAKPHIGTDNLRNVVKNIRNEIISLGGQIYFETCLTDIKVTNGRISAVVTNEGEIPTNNVVLSIGHSARDTFEMLLQKNILLQPKPFSVGVRIEHLQEDIDKGLYGEMAGHKALPKGEYQLSHRVENRGVYTFCMCPGGTVVPSSSEENTVVVNGMSEYARDGKNANSAVVVSVTEKDFGTNPRDPIQFQRKLESLAFAHGGNNYCAPVQTVGRFLEGKAGAEFGKVTPSYSIGTKEADFRQIFPSFVSEMLEAGLKSFNRKIKGFASADAVITGVETRTSSPVRILRGEDFTSVSLKGLYPCGEGAGYAGGIMSAAVDGIHVATAIIQKYSPFN